MPYEHTIEIELRDGVKVQFNYSGRPIERYAVLLLVLVEGEWQPARVFDNHLGTHHMHRYTRSGGKEAPEAFHPGPIHQAIPAAIDHLKGHWEAIIEAWKN